MTISELNRSLKKELESKFPITEAQSLASIILEHFGFSTQQIMKEPGKDADTKIRVEINKIVADLKNNKPIQYILGYTWFLDLKLIVNKNVLIPRPETEEMVLAIIKSNQKKNPEILDIGTGSGCIAVSLAHYIPHAKVLAMDIEENALSIAKQNAARNNTQIKFIRHSVFNQSEMNIENKLDLIVSNPPYVTESEKRHMDKNVLDHEPDTALYVKDTEAFIYYEAIIALAKTNLKDNGIIWVEINNLFGEECLSLFKTSGYKNSKLIKDIHGKNRFIKAVR